MATIVNKTFLWKATITVGTDVYTSAFRDPALDPTVPESVAVDASGASVAFVGDPTYVFSGVLYQDWTATGLSKAWMTPGTQVVIKMALPGSQGLWTFTVVTKPVKIGGSTNATAESPFSLPVIGLPVWSAS